MNSLLFNRQLNGKDNANKMNKKRPKMNAKSGYNNNFFLAKQKNVSKNSNISKINTNISSNNASVTNAAPKVIFTLSSNSSTSSLNTSPDMKNQKSYKEILKDIEKPELLSFNACNEVDIDERFIDKTTASLDVDYRQASSNRNLIEENIG